MKINWGNKLILVFLVFGSMIGYMVYRCTTIRTDLVSEEYYKDELVYQQTIDGTNRANHLTGVTSVSQDHDLITIRFPQEMKQAGLTGYALFYCASDARRDKKIALNVGPEAVQQISRRQLLPGNYIIKISWNRDNQHYYSEQPIIIQ